VRALGRVTQEALDALSGGITIKGMHYGAIEAMLDREQRANVWLTVGIREGKNREVRNVLEHLGLKVSRLIRVAFGPFELGEIERGGVVEVSIERMREALGDLVNRFDLEGPVFERENATRRHSGARAKARESEIQRKGQRSHLDPGPALRAARSDRKQTRRDRSGGPRPARPRPKGAR
jgi:23S rRNA pseudouridine2605 synthase